MAKVIVMEKPFVLKPYSKKELRTIMGVSKYIMQKWLKAIEPQLGQPVAGLYSVKQVQLIVDTYGIPGQVVNEAA
ncbi:MAG: hypothetical protein U0W65_02120 [Bacteroidia bacterium]|jgi:hypothetical protein